jgi:hypothetical protein
MKTMTKKQIFVIGWGHLFQSWNHYLGSSLKMKDPISANKEPFQINHHNIWDHFFQEWNISFVTTCKNPVTEVSTDPSQQLRHFYWNWEKPIDKLAAPFSTQQKKQPLLVDIVILATPPSHHLLPSIEKLIQHLKSHNLLHSQTHWILISSTSAYDPQESLVKEIEKGLRQIFKNSLTIFRPCGLISLQRHPKRFFPHLQKTPAWNEKLLSSWGQERLLLVEMDDVLTVLAEYLHHIKFDLDKGSIQFSNENKRPIPIVPNHIFSKKFFYERVISPYHDPAESQNINIDWKYSLLTNQPSLKKRDELILNDHNLLHSKLKLRSSLIDGKYFTNPYNL